MAAKHKVTVSVQPTKHWPSSVERRAAQVAAVATKQADLKREAAERRALNGNVMPQTASPRRNAR
jgi:hypothetical protein